MFATLLGSLPRPTGPHGEHIEGEDEAVAAAVEAQAAAGLGPLTDGRLRDAPGIGPIGALAGVSGNGRPARLTGRPVWRTPLTVDAWRFATNLGLGIVKQALPGPYTLGRRLGGESRDEAIQDFAVAIRRELDVLVDAGCAFVEVEEADAHLIGSDDTERRRFRNAHLRLLDGLDGIHVSLAITGGSADTAGIATIAAGAYPSLSVDLIDGPDNWRLVRALPGDRGVVCGAMSTRGDSDDGPELLLWAAGYAASSNARGIDRVGLATSGSLAGLTWAAAVRKMQRLGEASRLAAMPASDAIRHLDPRAIDLRSAAAGRFVPRPRKRPDAGGRVP